MKEVFDDHSETGLYMLQFHPLDHIVKDLEKVGSLNVLNTSPFEWYSVHIKRNLSCYITAATYRTE